MTKRKEGEAKESQIQTSIEHYLQFMENTGKLVYQKNQSGAFAVAHRGKTSYVRFGKKGSSDFLVWRKNNGHLETLFLEVKRPSGHQSESQREFEGKIKTLGGHYVIVHSLEEVQKVLE